MNRMQPLLTLAEADALRTYTNSCPVRPETRVAAERMIAESRARYQVKPRRPAAHHAEPWQERRARYLRETGRSGRNVVPFPASQDGARMCRGQA